MKETKQTFSQTAAMAKLFSTEAAWRVCQIGLQQALELDQRLFEERHMIDAVEIYRRPAEVPIEYGMTTSGDVAGGPCGVVVIWTKTR